MLSKSGGFAEKWTGNEKFSLNIVRFSIVDILAALKDGDSYGAQAAIA